MKHMNSLNQTFSVIVLGICCFSANAEAVDADAAKAFAKQNNCFRCHGVDKDKDGPAFTKIAAKFKADPKAEEKLLHHLSSGETAKFPDGHEEAHMILKADDPKETKNLVDWILSL
ncbi:MAG: c-type cytochrome [Methylococcaceae bacterium]